MFQHQTSGFPAYPEPLLPSWVTKQYASPTSGMPTLHIAVISHVRNAAPSRCLYINNSLHAVEANFDANGVEGFASCNSQYPWQHSQALIPPDDSLDVSEESDGGSAAADNGNSIPDTREATIALNQQRLASHLHRARHCAIFSSAKLRRSRMETRPSQASFLPLLYPWAARDAKHVTACIARGFTPTLAAETLSNWISQRTITHWGSLERIKPPFVAETTQLNPTAEQTKPSKLVTLSPSEEQRPSEAVPSLSNDSLPRFADVEIPSTRDGLLPLSYSRLSDYLFCPYKLRSAAGLPTVPTLPLLFGRSTFYRKKNFQHRAAFFCMHARPSWCC